LGVATVRSRDRVHDRQAESGTAPSASGIRTGEALKSVIDEVRREAWPCVLHVQLDALHAR